MSDFLSMLDRLSGLPVGDGSANFGDIAEYAALRAYFEAAQPTADDQPFPPGSRARGVLLQAALLIGELSKGLDKGDPAWEDLQKFGRDFDAVLTADALPIGGDMLSLDGAGGVTRRRNADDQARRDAEDADRWRWARTNLLSITYQGGMHNSGTFTISPGGNTNCPDYWDKVADNAIGFAIDTSQAASAEGDHGGA